MVVNSPLGKYSQIVAAGIAIAIVGAYLIALLVGPIWGISEESRRDLSVIALIAIGAVFGSAATINGVKAPLDAAHSRIDKLENGTGIATHGSYPAGTTASMQTTTTTRTESTPTSNGS